MLEQNRLRLQKRLEAFVGAKFSEGQHGAFARQRQRLRALKCSVRRVKDVAGAVLMLEDVLVARHGHGDAVAAEHGLGQDFATEPNRGVAQSVRAESGPLEVHGFDQVVQEGDGRSALQARDRG